MNLPFGVVNLRIEGKVFELGTKLAQHQPIVVAVGN